MLRSDAPLIRHLFERFGASTARDWQRPPLVLLPGQGFVRYLVEHEVELMELMPDIAHLPWDDVVFDYQDGRSVVTGIAAQTLPYDPALSDRGQCWIRVRTLPLYRRSVNISSPWMAGPRDLLAPFDDDPDRWLDIEAWEASVLRPGSSERGFPAYPDVSLVPHDAPWSFGAVAHLYPNLGCRSGRAYGHGHGFCNLTRCQFPPGHPVALSCHGSELVMSAGIRLTVLTLAYRMQSDDYLVEVRPPEAKGRKPRPAGKDPKPWTRALPHLILLDPLRAHEYGHPGGSRETETGGHLSPRAHQRRGHWRMLRHERFARDAQGKARRVFVKQAWIGASQWDHQGQRYRLVEPEAQHRSGSSA